MRVEITLLVGALGIHYARGHGKKYLYQIQCSPLAAEVRSGELLLPALLCHKDTVQGPPRRYFLSFALWHKGRPILDPFCA